MITINKLGKLMRGKYSLSQVLWKINRTKLGWGVKGVVSLWRAGEKFERKRLAKGLSADGGIKKHVSRLREEGYAVVTEEIEGSLREGIIDAGIGKLEMLAKLDAGQEAHRKGFWVRLLDEDFRKGSIDTENVFVRFALQERVLKTISAYFEEIPYLAYVLLSQSRYTEEEWKISQLWHRDYDDVRVVKLFSYLSEVKEAGDGPFTFLPSGASEKVRGRLSSHVADGEIFNRVPESQKRMMMGAEGTTFIVDTSRCYHMGSRVAPGRTRLMYTATYISAPPIYPGVDNGIVKRGALSRIEELVLRHGGRV